LIYFDGGGKTRQRLGIFITIRWLIMASMAFLKAELVCTLVNYSYNDFFGLLGVNRALNSMNPTTIPNGE
jgi:hypothetical protein